MKKVKIIGAGGYGGVGILELLLQHPEVELTTLVARDETGVPISTLYPHLDGHCDLPIHAADDPAAAEPADIVFFATPDGVAMRQAAAELKQGAVVIDYSGDFRFNLVDDYADYATRLGKDPVHRAPDLLAESVYGLPELAGNEIAGHRLVGNPGCFAVSCLLGLAPAVKNRLVELNSIICDCKTGVSGAGKKPAPSFHYPARHDHMNAYRLTGHQHVCEVEQNLGRLIGLEQLYITFTAQVVPVNRGIMACLYGELADGITEQDVLEAYRHFHRKHPFIRIYERHAAVGTAHVRGSNYCNLIVDVDERTNKLRVISHIDNLVKGQAGNALQNMNLLCGFPETLGLDRPPSYP